MAKPIHFVSIGSVEELRRLLVAGGVETSQWENGNTKSVDDLWAEIMAGESRIRRQPLQRVILGAVSVLVRRGERVLIETQQVFASGMARQRHLPPAEKMQPGEQPIDAAVRCLREELGVGHHDIEIVASSLPLRREVCSSPSYPGLATEYTSYTIEARVKGLPDGDFVTHEYGVHTGEWIMRHDWAWRLV